MTDPTPPLPKKMFAVYVREVHVQKHLVEASSEQEAIMDVANGMGELVDGSLEYSDTLDTDTWAAFEEES
jgi:hypothetical protein